VSVNLGPLVLTVMQFAAAGLGFLLGIALIPPGTPNRRIGLAFGVVGAVLLASVVYRRHVKTALPASLGGESDDSDEQDGDLHGGAARDTAETGGPDERLE